MSEDAAVMTDEATEAFLGDGGTGVLSLSTAVEEPPHAIPVSYGFDAAASVFYFRLAVLPDSEKGNLTDRPVTFVTYGEREAGWQSVVAAGRLEGTTEDAIATDTLEGLTRVHIPLFDVFDRPTRDVPFEFYRLVPESLTGREESTRAA